MHRGAAWSAARETNCGVTVSGVTHQSPAAHLLRLCSGELNILCVRPCPQLSVSAHCMDVSPLQIPQFVFIAAAESMIQVSGPAFAFAEAGPHMSSLVQAVWYMMQLGQMVTGVIALVKVNAYVPCTWCSACVPNDDLVTWMPTRLHQSWECCVCGLAAVCSVTAFFLYAGMMLVCTIAFGFLAKAYKVGTRVSRAMRGHFTALLGPCLASRRWQ